MAGAMALSLRVGFLRVSLDAKLVLVSWAMFLEDTETMCTKLALPLRAGLLRPRHMSLDNILADGTCRGFNLSL